MIRYPIILASLVAVITTSAGAQDAPSPAIEWLVQNCLENDGQADLCKAFRNGIRYQLHQLVPSSDAGSLPMALPNQPNIRTRSVIPNSIVVTPPSDPGYIVK